MTRHLSQLAFFAVGEVNHVDKNGFIFSDNKNTWWGDMWILNHWVGECREHIPSGIWFFQRLPFWYGHGYLYFLSLTHVEKLCDQWINVAENETE